MLSQAHKQPSQNSKQPSQNSKPPSQTSLPSQPQIVINIDDSAKTYFNSRVPEEENPILLGVSTNIRL